jgi:1-acyl-sn-glycerol-3-phosphate acyltransferase
MFYLLRLTFILLVTIPLAVLTIFLGLFDLHGKRVYAINRFWTWLILRVGGVSLNVKGLENIEPRKQYVFMVNHQSNIDIPVLVQSLAQFQLRWIAKKELLWVPFFGWAMWATKHITVDRADPSDAMKSLQRARQRMAAGISVVVFPEGTRGRDGKLMRFKKGGFLLAVQAQRHIVPITINGSGRILPSGAWRMRSGVIEVIVEKPIAVEGYRAGNLRLLAEQTRQAIAAHLRQPAALPADTAGESKNPATANRAMEQRSA